jgi:SAM-dependent methyltransferase
MKTLKEHFITYVVKEAVRRAGEARAPRILDIGCGTASYVPQLIESISNFEYVGVEPIPKSFASAEKNLAKVPNAKVHFQLAYDSVPEEKEASFDLVFSLSALEHVKDLNRFITLSAKYAKKGGLVVHRYDLGHALQPHSFKERLHVCLGNTVPKLLPERQFVRYLGVPEVKALYEKSGVMPFDVTYHQMPDHKHLEKFFKDSKSTIIDELFTWEMSHQSEFCIIPEVERERLFPAVAVWGEKQ